MIQHDIWEGWSLQELRSAREVGNEQRQKERQRRRLRQQKICVQRLAERYPDLAFGRPNLTHGQSYVTELFDEICNDAGGHERRDRHNFLVRGLSRGVTDLGWQMPIPNPMMVDHQETSPATPASFEKLRIFRTLQKAFFTSLEQDLKELSDASEQQPAMAGRLLFSAISQGLLLNKKWLATLPTAIKRGLESYQALFWMDLRESDMLNSEHDPEPSSEVIRRFFPDPLTLLLLNQWYRRWGHTWPNQDPEALLTHFCRRVAPELPLPSSLLRLLLDTAETAASLTYPGLIRYYAQGRYAGASLDAINWHRLLSKQVPVMSVQLGLSTPLVTVELQNRSNLSVRGSYRDQLRALRKLQSTIGKHKDSAKRGSEQTKKAVDQFLKREEPLSPIVRLLALWCKHLMHRGSIMGNKLRPSSVETYLSTIGASLVSHAAGLPDLETFSAEDWQTLYDLVLESSVSDRRRSDRGARLCDFHAFLVQQFSVPPVDIERRNSNSRQVDAQLISPAEYMRARKIIQNNNCDSSLRQIQELVLILGYRCGLRRTEVQTLLLQDLPGVHAPALDYPEVIVRANRHGTVKSAAGVRRLPLWILLMPDELDMLRSYLASRIRKTVGQPRLRSLLFSYDGQDNLPIEDSALFVPIQEALRQATGNPGARFHYLRHSCATLLILRMLEENPGQYLPEEWATDDSERIVLPHWGQDLSQKAGLAERTAPSSKRLWTVSLWCGHADPSETLASYTHLLDWLSYRMTLEHADPELSMSAQASLLGISQQSVSVIRNRHGLLGTTRASQLLHLIQRKWECGMSAYDNAVTWTKHEALPALPPLEARPKLSAVLIYQLFLHAEHLKETPSLKDNERWRQAAKLFDVNERDVFMWRSHAEILTGLKTHKGRMRISRSKDPKGLTTEQRTGVTGYAPETPLCIAPPRPPKAQRMANDLFAKVISWHEEDKSDCERALSVVFRHMQRTKTQLKLPDTQSKRVFVTLLAKLGLRRYTTIQVTLTQQDRTPPVREYWSRALGVEQSQIIIKRKDSQQPTINPMGNAQVILNRMPELSERQNILWPTLRFALFTAAIALQVPDLSES